APSAACSLIAPTLPAGGTSGRGSPRESLTFGLGSRGGNNRNVRDYPPVGRGDAGAGHWRGDRPGRSPGTVAAAGGGAVGVRRGEGRDRRPAARPGASAYVGREDRGGAAGGCASLGGAGGIGLDIGGGE